MPSLRDFSFSISEFYNNASLSGLGENLEPKPLRTQSLAQRIQKRLRLLCVVFFVFFVV
jgi:hypothetical protein